MKKFFKILAITAGILVFLVVLLTLSLTFLVPWDKVKGVIEKRGTEYLQREVKIEKLEFNIFRGAEIKGFSIGNRKGFSKEPFVSADSASLNYSFWMLFKGQILLTKIELIKPKIIIEKNTKAEYSFQDIINKINKAGRAENANKNAEETKNGKPELPVELNVSKFALVDGEIQYMDMSVNPPVKAAIRSADINVNGLSLNGEKPFDFSVSAKAEYQGQPFDFEADGSMKINFNKQELSLINYRVNLPGVDISGNAEVKKFIDEPDFMFNVSGNIETGKLFKAVSPVFLAKMREYIEATSVSGEAKLDAKITGRVKTGKTPDIEMNGSGSADISKVEIKYSDVFRKTKDLNAGLKYDFTVKGETVKLNADLKTNKSTIRVISSVSDFSAPKISASVSADADVAETVSMLPLLDDTDFSGKSALKLDASLNITKDYKVDYKSIKLNGKGKIADFGALPKKFKYGISKLNADINLNEKIIELKNLSFISGSSSLFKGEISAANFNLKTLTEWKTKFEGDVKFSLSSDKFLIDEIMDAFPKKDTAVVAVAGSKVPDEKTGFSDAEMKEYTQYVYKDLRLAGTVVIKNISYKKINFTDIRSEVKLNNRKATVVSALSAYSGTVKADKIIDMNIPGLGYEASGTMANVNMGDFTNAVVDSFFSKVVADMLKDKIMGSVRSDFAVKGAGSNKKDFKKNLVGNINYKVTDGKIKNIKILKDALTALKVNVSDEIPFREMNGKIRIADQKIFIDENRVICDEARYFQSGEVGFDKDLDSELSLKLQNDFAPQYVSKLGDVSAYASDENGWMPLDVDIKGRLLSPSFTPNMERSLKNAGKKLQKKAEEEIKSKGEDLKKQGEDFLKNLFKK